VFGTLGPGKLMLQASDGTHQDFFLGNSVLPLATFVHVAATADGTTVRLYINGVLDAEYPQSVIPFSNTQPFQIGAIANDTADSNFSRIIDELDDNHYHHVVHHLYFDHVHEHLVHDFDHPADGYHHEHHDEHDSRDHHHDNEHDDHSATDHDHLLHHHDSRTDEHHNQHDDSTAADHHDHLDNHEDSRDDDYHLSKHLHQSRRRQRRRLHRSRTRRRGGCRDGRAWRYRR
jgi:hypothetical protein